jgi:hypothetical protein
MNPRQTNFGIKLCDHVVVPGQTMRWEFECNNTQSDKAVKEIKVELFIRIVSREVN